MITRRRCKVVFSDRETGRYNSQVVLDTGKLSNIGFTKKSLYEYINDVFTPMAEGLMYYVESDKVKVDTGRWYSYQEYAKKQKNL